MWVKMNTKIAAIIIASVVGALFLAVAPAPAAGDWCPGVEVTFARGTDEPGGVGDLGQQFIDSLTAHVRSVGTYAVDYPASNDWTTSTVAGVTDAAHHIEYMANNCPSTRLVLGGYSQGAAVAGFVTSAIAPPGVDIGDLQVMDPYIASHVAAVVLFGTPSPMFLGMLGEPPIMIGPLYADKVIQLCNDNDPVCSDAGLGGDWAAHNSYGGDRVDEAVTFTVWRI